MDSEQWNSKYRTAEKLWSATPNAFVAAYLEALPAGRAIDLAAGEGRNALWLAKKGWKVTAVDFSEVAIERGRAADEEKLVDWRIEDLESFEPEKAAFDLVLLSYLQLPWSAMESILAKASGALAPGGTLFLIAHDARNLAEGYGGPQSDVVLYSPEAVARALPGLMIDEAKTVEREVETESGVETALDCLVRARRAL